jgi:hypothetical protein
MTTDTDRVAPVATNPTSTQPPSAHIMAHLAALDDAFEAWWMDEGADMTAPYTTRRSLARIAFLRGVQAGRKVML